MYPQKIKISESALDELKACEWGSFEDWQGVEAAERAAYYPNAAKELHVVEICQRHRTMIELRNDVEAATLFFAVSTGTFQLSSYTKGGGYSWLPTAVRLANLTRDAAMRIDPTFATRVQGPNGY